MTRPPLSVEISPLFRNSSVLSRDVNTPSNGLLHLHAVRAISVLDGGAAMSYALLILKWYDAVWDVARGKVVGVICSLIISVVPEILKHLNRPVGRCRPQPLSLPKGDLRPISSPP